ncbi:MAG: hypothetical protein WC205_18450 [Opitutaceae bacterium]|jgi:hypothetical protein
MRKLILFLLIAPMVAIAGVEGSACAVLGHVEGHVLVRVEGSQKLQPVAEGRSLSWGEGVITGDASRYEVHPATGGGLWRVGRRAVFMLKEGGARLLAGTALVQVPAKALWRVESIRSAVVLPEGSWFVQAVDNRGLKIVCLDGSEPIQAWGDPSKPAEAAAVASLRMKPGELVFLQPEGKAFSPVVTIYLEEALGTSRLVNGFPEPVPGMPRLINLGTAQRERLTKLSPAVVVGANKAGGFQIAVPNPPKPESAGEGAVDVKTGEK